MDIQGHSQQGCIWCVFIIRTLSLFVCTGRSRFDVSFLVTRDTWLSDSERHVLERIRTGSLNCCSGWQKNPSRNYAKIRLCLLQSVGHKPSIGKYYLDITSASLTALLRQCQCLGDLDQVRLPPWKWFSCTCPARFLLSKSVVCIRYGYPEARRLELWEGWVSLLIEVWICSYCVSLVCIPVREQCIT